MSQRDSDSEEEILVYAEFEDSVNIDKYRAIHILGADNKNPIIQLDETFFMGKYENALGTYMFFEEDPIQQSKDPLFDKYPEKGVKYVYKTRKYVSMEHAYVTPKEGKDSNAQSQSKQMEDDVQPVIFKDLPQATEAFKAYFTNPKSAIKTTELNSPGNTQSFIEISIDTNTNTLYNTELTDVQNIVGTGFESINIENPVDRAISSTITQNVCDVEIESTCKGNPVDPWIQSKE